MSNSPLVSYTNLSPHNGGKRKNAIDRITPHCVVGQWSAKKIADYFKTTSRKASCNYGIGKDGAVSLCVEEDKRSFCSSSSDNDNRSVTIECASDTKPPYAMTDAVWASLINLCVDICKRNGKKKLLWFGDKNTTLKYAPKSDEMVITVHRWFAAKACPGDWLYSILGKLADEVTKQLGGKTTTQTMPQPNTVSATSKDFRVQVATTNLNIRTGPSTKYVSVGKCQKGIYTIIEEKDGWGRLKSGKGWICLKYVKRV